MCVPCTESRKVALLQERQCVYALQRGGKERERQRERERERQRERDRERDRERERERERVM